MNVCNVFYNLGFGGAEKNIYDVVKNSNDDSIMYYFIVFRRTKGFIDEIDKLKNAKVFTIGISNRYNPMILVKLIGLFLKIKPDVIHTHLAIPSIWVRFANFFIRTKVITTQHSVYFKNNLFHKIDRFTARRNDLYLANSEFTKQFLVKHNYINSDKIKLLKLGIDVKKISRSTIDKTEAKKKFNIDSESVVFGHIGSFKFHKGHKYLVNFFYKIHQRVPNAVLFLIGKGELEGEVRGKLNEYGLTDNVVILEQTSEIPLCFSAMDYFIFPSVSESFGLSVAEAMICKVPVVAFNTDAIPELVINKKTGMLVDKGDYDGLVDSTMYLMDNEPERLEMVENAFNLIENNLSIEKMVQNLENIYLSYKG